MIPSAIPQSPRQGSAHPKLARILKPNPCRGIKEGIDNQRIPGFRYGCDGPGRVPSWTPASTCQIAKDATSAIGGAEEFFG